jgi:hypothetical protein
MFEWARGAKLREMIRAGVPGARHDPWLEGWMVGFVQHAWALEPPVRVLDVALGDGDRPHLDWFRRRGAEVETLEPGRLAGRAGKYGLVTLLSFERQRCLEPLDFEDPLAGVRRLLDAARCLEPGGVLLWSGLYCYPDSPERVHSFLEPAAVYQCLTRRGFRPLAGDGNGTERLAIYHHLDTLWVPQKTTLEYSDSQRRITRVLCAVARPDGAPRLAAPAPAPRAAAARPARRPPELSGRQLLRLLAKKVWARAGRLTRR